MFVRQPLRNAVQREILSRLADGRLPAGVRINETHLSTDLGISRTPLREAMLHLEADGFLTSDMGKGFVVPPLDGGEFIEIQDILARLEPLALSLTLPLTGQRIMELNNLLGRSKLRAMQPGPDQPAALTELVSRWGFLLAEHCPNAILRHDVLRLQGLARRYWFAATAGGYSPREMIASLEDLYELVRTGQTARASSHLSEHIQRCAQEAGRCLPAARPRASGPASPGKLP